MPDELSVALAQGVVGAIETTGAYAGGFCLRSSTPGLHVYGLMTLARRAAEPGNTAVRRIRLRGPDGRSHLLEFSGREGTRLTGSLLDLGSEPVVGQAADRFPRGTGGPVLVRRPGVRGPPPGRDDLRRTRSLPRHPSTPATTG